MTMLTEQQLLQGATTPSSVSATAMISSIRRSTVSQVKSDEWMRRTYETIGGSHAAAAVGESPWVKRWKLANTMRDVIHRQILPDQVESPDMRRGTILEPIAVSMLCHEHNLATKTHWEIYYSKDMPWAHARIDAMSTEGDIIEVKVPRPLTYRRYILNGIPRHYYLQAQHYMAVLERDKVYFGCMCPMTMELYSAVIHRCDTTIKALMDGELELWESVMKDEPVEEADAESVTHGTEVFEGGAETKAAVHPEMKETAQSYLRCKEIADEASDLLSMAKSQLLEQAGDDDAVVVPGVLKFYNTLVCGRTTYDVKRAVSDHPDLMAKYKKTGKPHRTFRAYLMRDPNVS